MPCLMLPFVISIQPKITANHPVAQVQDPVPAQSRFEIMGHHDNALSAPVDAGHNIEHIGA
ncbi:hypothetical protein D3C86_2037540 [compost metagenome]